MFNFFKKFFDYNEREVQRLLKKVENINKMEDSVRRLKDSGFPKETKRLKEKIKGDVALLDEQDIAHGAALVREAARRVLNLRHFDVQLVAGLALHDGKIIEQKTGEGKTLSATIPLYLNALANRGTHLVTVNDYLARRDAGWMGTIFHFLGMSTGAMISDKSFVYDPEFNDPEATDWRLSHLRPATRREAYVCDITYGINSEFGFDYLRDNMAGAGADMVQRDFFYAVVDEADSVLIDEARTPHIISAPYDEDTSKYYKYASTVKRLDEKTDYVIDEKLRTANLTEAGIGKIESILGVDNIYEKDFDTLFHIEAALKAQTLFKIDKEYIVKDGEVVIVDEFTGRLLQGRRFSEGLHQAIEAKEGVTIQRESKTLATVSLQNYFRMYKKLAGMTGTAATEAEEFHKIYKTDVVIVPTHRKMVRRDNPDLIYKTERGKFNAVVEEIAKNYKAGRPVLVGTTSIQKNEHLSRLLQQKGVPHELLNAKNHEKEATIIANAGKKGAVTVATNMAGRGVDIILGGSTPQEEESKNKKEYEKKLSVWQKAHDEVVSLGGLLVIGTERHESRRIDNQLRGRSGRQGDPGESLFFVALEDDLMRIFGGEQISKLMTFFNFPEDQPLTHSMVSKAIEQAQVKVEGFNFDIRKHLVDYDDVLNKQRQIVYSFRKNILMLPEQDKTEFRSVVFEKFRDEIGQVVNTYFSLGEHLTPEDITKFHADLNFIVPVEKKDVEESVKRGKSEVLLEGLDKKIEDTYRYREKKYGGVLWSDVTRGIFLSTIDRFWTDHLTAIEDLREGINLRGYAQMDPLVEYKNEAYSMFEKLMSDINFEATRRLFKVEIQQISQGEVKKVEEPSDNKKLIYKSATNIDAFSTAQKQSTEQIQPQEQNVRQEKYGDTTVTYRSRSGQTSTPNANQGFKVIPPGSTHNKIGRNDPCWCGSGKKYKKCHMISDLG